MSYLFSHDSFPIPGQFETNIIKILNEELEMDFSCTHSLNSNDIVQFIAVHSYISYPKRQHKLIIRVLYDSVHREWTLYELETVDGANDSINSYNATYIEDLCDLVTCYIWIIDDVSISQSELN